MGHKHHRRSSAACGLLAACLAGVSTGCFVSTFASGRPCAEDRDCGKSLACVDGYCGGLGPVDETSSGATAGGSTEVQTSTGAASSGATTQGAETTQTTGSPYLCDKIDFLVVLDTSKSMNQWDGSLLMLASNLVTYVTPLLGVVDSYHFGVVAASAIDDNSPDCRVDGGLWVSEGEGVLCDQYSEKRYLDESDPLEVLNLLCLLGVNGGPDDERPMQSMLRAVSPELNAPGECNQDFIRDDALLVVMLITDEDDDHDDEQGNDGSPGDPQFWYEKLLYYKRGNANSIVFGAFLGEDPDISPCPWMLPPDKSEETVSTVLSIGAEEGDRIRQFMDELPVGHAYVGSVCDDSYISFFQQFYQEIVHDACEDFNPLDTDPLVQDPTEGDPTG